MRTGLLARKMGMTRVYLEDGRHLPVTVLAVEDCQVVAQRTAEQDGYTALQLGAVPAKAKEQMAKRRRPPQAPVVAGSGPEQTAAALPPSGPKADTEAKQQEDFHDLPDLVEDDAPADGSDELRRKAALAAKDAPDTEAEKVNKERREAIMAKALDAATAKLVPLVTGGGGPGVEGVPQPGGSAVRVAPQPLAWTGAGS